MQVKLLNTYGAFEYEVLNTQENNILVLRLWRKDKDWEPIEIYLHEYLKATVDEFTKFLMDWTHEHEEQDKVFTIGEYVKVIDSLFDDFEDVADEVEENLSEEDQDELVLHVMEKIMEWYEDE
jgi:transcription antitermination factor NusG